MMMKSIIIQTVKDVVKKNDTVIFAYLFGSFLEVDTYRDIDIAVFCDDAVLKNPFALTSDLKISISNVTDIPADIFDIVLINYCIASDRADSLFVMYNIFQGLLIKDEKPDLRTDIIEKLSRQLRESEGLLAEAYS